MTLLTGIVAAIASKIVADEAKAWMPNLSRYLLGIAVSRLPVGLRERYQEEWAADLASYPGEIGRLVRALGFCWASVAIRKSAGRSLRERIALRIWLWLVTVLLRLLARKIRQLTSRRLVQAVALKGGSNSSGPSPKDDIR